MGLNEKFFPAGGGAAIEDMFAYSSLSFTGCSNSQRRINAAISYGWTAAGGVTQAKIEVYKSSSSDMSTDLTLVTTQIVSTGTGFLYAVYLYDCNGGAIEFCYPSPYCSNRWLRMTISDNADSSNFFYSGIQQI